MGFDYRIWGQGDPKYDFPGFISNMTAFSGFTPPYCIFYDNLIIKTNLKLPSKLPSPVAAGLKCEVLNLVQI